MSQSTRNVKILMQNVPTVPNAKCQNLHLLRNVKKGNVLRLRLEHSKNLNFKFGLSRAIFVPHHFFDFEFRKNVRGFGQNITCRNTHHILTHTYTHNLFQCFISSGYAALCTAASKLRDAGTFPLKLRFRCSTSSYTHTHTHTQTDTHTAGPRATD